MKRTGSRCDESFIFYFVHEPGSSTSQITNCGELRDNDIPPTPGRSRAALIRCCCCDESAKSERLPRNGTGAQASKQVNKQASRGADLPVFVRDKTQLLLTVDQCEWVGVGMASIVYRACNGTPPAFRCTISTCM